MALDPIIVRMINEAIAQGRHSRTWQTVCQGCGEWVPAIFYVTEDGR